MPQMTWKSYYFLWFFDIRKTTNVHWFLEVYSAPWVISSVIQNFKYKFVYRAAPSIWKWLEFSVNHRILKIIFFIVTYLEVGLTNKSLLANPSKKIKYICANPRYTMMLIFFFIFFCFSFFFYNFHLSPNAATKFSTSSPIF